MERAKIMGLLEELMGGGQRQQEYADYVARYDQGPPHEGITDQEAGHRYTQVAGEVDPDTYRQSAQDALANMGENERAQYAQQLSTVANQQGIDPGWDGQSTDPSALAHMTTAIHQQSPGLLSSLLGGGSGGLSGLLGGGTSAGGQGGGGLGGALSGLLAGGSSGGGSSGGGGNPIMRAALGGIAAMAAKRVMGGGGGLFGG
jgi:hypothetical protein